MSLIVYARSWDVPEGLEFIRFNDAFFDFSTTVVGTPEVRELMHKIDNVTYLDSTRVLVERASKEYAINQTELSTGLKTILNIIHHPKTHCFDTVECGENVMNEIVKLKEGNIVWTSGSLLIDGECDIMFQDEHYTSIQEALHAIRYY